MRDRREARGCRERPFREGAQFVRIEVRSDARRACAVNVIAQRRPPARAASKQRVDLFVEALFHLKLKTCQTENSRHPASTV
jgi:hypothetical protein